MNEKKKANILKRMSEKLDKVTYGKITIELRGPDRPVDIVIEDRERLFLDKKNITSEDNK